MWVNSPTLSVQYCCSKSPKHLLLLKTYRIAVFPVQPFLFPDCLIVGPDAPSSRPQRALTPSCHSKADGFIHVELSHNPVTLSVWLLSIPAHTFSPCFAEPGQINHNLPLLLFHLYLRCLFPKFHLAIICVFSFLFSITPPTNTSLSLICFSYSLSHLSLPFPP